MTVLVSELREHAHALGFVAFGIARPQASERTKREFLGFLAAGCHGDMEWMARDPEKRASVERLWPEARSVIVVGASYAPDFDPLAAVQEGGDGAVIASYARGGDYHKSLKKRLKQLASWLAERGSRVKVFVDTAPLLEKDLAERAGLGWRGKHTNLVSRQRGSWLLIGEILTDLELPPSQPGKNLCGSCRACIEVCPTRAITAPYRLDARLCISYLTIEAKGPIPRPLRRAVGNRVFGCDDCLAVCPWNKFARRAHERLIEPYGNGELPRLGELLALDEDSFRQLFRGTSIKRTGRDRMVRNALVAAGNSGDRELLPAVEKLLRDSAALVRGAAVWAAARLASDEGWPALCARHYVAEKDPQVLEEWRLERQGEEAAK